MIDDTNQLKSILDEHRRLIRESKNKVHLLSIKVNELDGKLCTISEELQNEKKENERLRIENTKKNSTAYKVFQVFSGVLTILAIIVAVYVSFVLQSR